MKKSSKKHIGLLAFTLASMLALSISVNMIMTHVVFFSMGSARSGEFVNTSQGVNVYGWYFYADEANGNSSFFAHLSQSELNNITITSKIESGEAVLVITQESIRFSYDLCNNNALTIISSDLLNPGRVDMRLYLTYAANISVRVNWRDSNY